MKTFETRTFNSVPQLYIYNATALLAIPLVYGQNMTENNSDASFISFHLLLVNICKF